MSNRYLITGGCGFLGSNLAAEAIRLGKDLLVLDNLSRHGSDQNLKWLRSLGQFQFKQADTRDATALRECIREFRPEVTFHLAGQVAMTTSLENPRLDFEVNVVGGHNVLEAIRELAPECAMIYSSTNKVYGDLEYLKYREADRRYEAVGFERGFDEKLGLEFHSPYGCSKGAMDQYMLDYARVFGLKTAVFRHSSIFGDRQFSTFDQGWIGWFVQKAIEQKQGKRDPFTISGTGKQVRDVLFVTDLVSCYFQASDKIERCRGKAFNIGGGMQNSVSLLELFDFLEAELGVKLEYQKLDWRKSDQKVFVADTAEALRCFDWKPSITKETGLRNMIRWVNRDAR
jgi:CDP-paratose 2-epimerase